MKAVVVTSNKQGETLDRQEAEFATQDAAKLAALNLFAGDEEVHRVVVHEDLRPVGEDGKPTAPNVHDPKHFAVRVDAQRPLAGGDPEFIGLSWPE